MKVNNVAIVVKKVLEREPITRDSDNELIKSVIEDYGVSCQLPFCVVLKKIAEKKLPTLESITRSRRKVQEENPELRASQRVEDARINLTADYINLAIKGVIE